MTKIFYILVVFVLTVFCVNAQTVNGYYGQTVTGSYLHFLYPYNDTSIITLNSDNTFTLYEHFPERSARMFQPKTGSPELIITIYGTWSQKNNTISTHPKKILSQGEKKAHRLRRRSFYRDKEHTQYIFEEDCLFPLEFWTFTNKDNFKYCLWK